MRKSAIFFVSFILVALSAFAGFKVKLVKPKKAEQFQTRVTVGGVTYAADLLLEGKDQKDYFYKELTSSDLIAVRLAVFNSGKEELVLPGDLELVGPDGNDVPLVGPDTVARAVVQGLVVGAQAKKKQGQPPASAGGAGSGDPRTDPTDPRYDPRSDPNDPRYDPTNRPYDPRAGGDPRGYPSDPSDPRYDPTDPSNRRYGRGGYGVPGIVLTPGQGGGGDLTQFEKQLVEKDFDDKAHTTDPIEPSTTRDRFLFFTMKDRPATARGFTLRLPKSKGIPDDVTVKF